MWTVISVDLEVAWWWHISMSVSVSVLGCLCPCPCFHTLVHVYVHVGAYVYVNSMHPIFLSISNPSWYCPTVPTGRWPASGQLTLPSNTTPPASPQHLLLVSLTGWMTGGRTKTASAILPPARQLKINSPFLILYPILSSAAGKYILFYSILF